MAASGGQPGNRNAAKAKPWREAVTRAFKKDRGALDRLARALIRSAESGDVAALREFGDRVDGKVVQGMEISLTEAIADQMKAARERTGK